MRQCGDCQLCCKLVPVNSLGKDAGVRCRHQKAGKGCLVYHKPGMPPECALWTCRWLGNNDTADLSRPNRSHYVLDVIPDYITMLNNETGEREAIQAVQIWVDPNFPDAHRDPALRRYLERRAEENIVGLVRWNNERGLVIFPPALSRDGQWNEVGSNLSAKTHSLAETAAALGGEVINVVMESR
jgi:hypothetical protein